ncbi:ribonuclease H-like domain-containing protein [Tanacetum coccineum]
MPTHPMVTRAKSNIFKPLERMNCHVTTTSPLPRSHVHALRDPNWKEAMLDEYNALITNGTWVLVPRPANVTLSRSSAEAEYRGVANVVAKTAWIRNLLCELHAPLFTATLVYCDNVSVVYMSANPVQHQRMKHIEIDIHFVCDFVTSGQVRVLHVPSRFQYGDIFTKGLPTALFIEFRSSLNVRRSPAHTEGEY